MRSAYRRGLAIAFFTFPMMLSGETFVRRSYPVSNLGSLVLKVPDSWTEALQVPKNGLPPTVSLTDPTGEVEILITPIPTPKGEEGFQSGARLRDFVRQAAVRVLPTAAEKELPLQAIRTRSGGGFYFWATDRAPKAGEFEYMAQGAVPAGSLFLSFTVLTHRKPPPALNLPLRIIGSAEHER